MQQAQQELAACEAKQRKQDEALSALIARWHANEIDHSTYAYERDALLQEAEATSTERSKILDRLDNGGLLPSKHTVAGLARRALNWLKPQD